jgi:hypothetical protein
MNKLMNINRFGARRIPGRRRRYRTRKIKSTAQLVKQMRGGWRLVKTYHFPGVLEWSCGADLVDPLIAKQAIAAGLIVSRDPGLFAGDEVSQSFELNQ